MHILGSADSNGHRKATSLFADAIREQFGESEPLFLISSF